MQHLQLVDCTLERQCVWYMGEDAGGLGQPTDVPIDALALGTTASNHIANVLTIPFMFFSPYFILFFQRPFHLYMSEKSDSSGSGSFKASFVTVSKLALERKSIAECIMGRYTSSMFGITNIFCGRQSQEKVNVTVLLVCEVTFK